MESVKCWPECGCDRTSFPNHKYGQFGLVDFRVWMRYTAKYTNDIINKSEISIEPSEYIC